MKRKLILGLFLYLGLCAIAFWGGRAAHASTFTADGQATDVINVLDGDTVDWTASTDNSSSIIEIQVTSSPKSGNWKILRTVSTASQSGSILNEGGTKWYRAYCKDFKTGATMSGTVAVAARTLEKWQTKYGTTIFEIKDTGVSTATIADGTLAAGDVALARGAVLVGNSSGVASALSAKTSGRILVGDGNDVASVAVSSDATLASTGALTIADNAIDLTDFADDARAAVVRVERHRVTAAEINAGHTVLAAVTGYKYRIANVKAIAYGGNAGTATSVDVLGTQGTSSVKLVAFAVTSLTRSVVLTAGDTGATVLADGASFTACDAATAITVGKTGDALNTATGVDVIIEYVLDAA